MKVVLSQPHLTQSGLRFAVRIEHEKAGWIRFSTTVLLLENLTWEERRAVTRWLDGAEIEREDLGEDLSLF